MSDLTFTAEDAPTIKRGPQRGSNPFANHFPTDEGKSLGLVVNGIKGNPDSKTISTLTRLAREAAKALDLSARVVAGDPAPKSGDVKMNFFTGPRIVRKRKTEK